MEGRLGPKPRREAHGVLRAVREETNMAARRNAHSIWRVKLEVLILGVWGAQPDKLDSGREN